MDDQTNAVELALLRQDVELLKSTIEKQNAQIAELIQAWQAASALVSFVKMLGALALAAGAVVAFVKGGPK